MLLCDAQTYPGGAMKQTDEILKRQQTQHRFHNKDMDFTFSWLLGTGSLVGLSHGELFNAVAGMKDGDAAQWCDRLGAHAELLLARAAREGGPAAGQDRLAAAFCHRAVLQYTDPTSPAFAPRVEAMERTFLAGAGGLGVPVRAVEVPFEGKTLSGYLLEHDGTPRPWLVMVGGGDSYREDLFTFAGYPAWRRGYNALMVDLPGQGAMPARGFTFRADMADPVSATLDFLGAQARCPPERVALYGVSGGGYITAQAAATEPRIGVWIASTPITDLAALFRTEFGAALKAPGWLTRAVLGLAGALNESAELSLRKYAWQFGTADFKSAVTELLAQARPVDVAHLACPSLFLLGESEAAELKHQTQALAAALSARGVNVTVRSFSAAEGGAHCQVDNPRLAHRVVFDWLDGVVTPKAPPVDPRLLAW